MTYLDREHDDLLEGGVRLSGKSASSDRRTDQSGRGLMEMVLCLAKVLHESDPTIAARLNFEAGLAYNRLRNSGDEEAAALVYAFGRALLDREAFPRPDDDF